MILFYLLFPVEVFLGFFDNFISKVFLVYDSLLAAR